MTKQKLFAKLQGMGNDFLILVVDDVSVLPDAGEAAKQMCDRVYGAGADGLVLVSRSDRPDADFESRIFNADGGEAEVSGNGTRCAAAYVYYSGLWQDKDVRIGTVAGVKRGRLAARSKASFEFQFEMGMPRFSSREIPMALTHPLDRVVRYGLTIGGETFEVTCVSMGNPHCTLFVPGFDGLSIGEIGPLIEDHPVFPNRTNVEFARVLSQNEIEVIFWERGVGRTNSSGTGSCGAAVAAALNDLTGRKVLVRTAGGALNVDWGDDGIVRLTGSAEVVYEGRWLRD
jgi:diaminopimelate epimerase